MRILICDDDEQLLEQLKKYIREFFEKIDDVEREYLTKSRQWKNITRREIAEGWTANGRGIENRETRRR